MVLYTKGYKIIFIGGNMGMKIKNVMEELVEEKIEGIMKEAGCCTCERCEADVAAYVLNRIPPKYVATEKGELITKSLQFDREFKVKLLIMISEGARVVKESPRH